VSLVSLFDKDKVDICRTDEILDIDNGIMIQPILECKDLKDIEYTERKPDGLQSNFAVVATFLANLGDIRLMHDKRTNENMWWGFMIGRGRLYMRSHAKHVKPTYFS